MSKEKHTPLQVGRVYKNVVFDNKGNIIADCNSPQMAEIIIKSVNNHCRLVEALEKLVETTFDNSCQHFNAHREAKQLLTELKA